MTHLKLTCFAAAVLAVNAGNDFLSKVRNGGLCVDSDFEDDRHHDFGIADLDVVTTKDSIFGGASGLGVIPPSLASSLDTIGEAIPLTLSTGPGSFVGSGVTTGHYTTCIPARQIDVTVQTETCDEGSSDAHYNTQQKKG